MCALYANFGLSTAEFIGFLRISALLVHAGCPIYMNMCVPRQLRHGDCRISYCPTSIINTSKLPKVTFWLWGLPREALISPSTELSF